MLEFCQKRAFTIFSQLCMMTLGELHLHVFLLVPQNEIHLQWSSYPSLVRIRMWQYFSRGVDDDTVLNDMGISRELEKRRDFS